MRHNPTHLLTTLLLCCTLASVAQDKQELILSYHDSAKHYEALNKNRQAYEFTKKALRLMLSVPATEPDKLARMESDLGTFAYRMGNIDLSATHHRKALKIALSLPEPNYDCLYLSGNNMGSIMWFASKMDSALYYFQIAVNAVSKMDSTAQNKYYRPAVLYNNMAGIYGVQGKTTEGISAMQKTIQNLRAFLAVKDSTLRKDNALHFQFEATDNLAGIYKELGDYSKAHDLLTHSYQQKQKTLTTDDPDIYKSEVLLGQLYYAMKDHMKAEQFLLKGLKGFDTADGDFLFWKADAYYTLALISEQTHREQKAAGYYEQADSLYEQSLNGEYDNIYLEFLNNASLYYATQHSPSIALNKAMKGYRYIVSTEGEQTLSGFYQLLNLSDVHFKLYNYPEALNYSKKALRTVNAMIGTGSNMLDSIKMEIKKPKAILLQARCEYALLETKTPGSLTAILKQLREALAILERRKSILQDAKDVNLFISDHKDLLDFVKKITLELHTLTKDPVYIDELISLHESGLYNRIRARLGHIQFAGVPAHVQSAEKALKDELNNAVSSNEDHDDKMHRYIQAEEKWKLFLDTVRIKYPEYYKMRYATIFMSLKDVMGEIPAGTTVIRFVFAEKNLLALVADHQQRQLITLNAAGLDEDVEVLFKYATDEEKCGEVLNSLYNRLWQPLVKSIRRKRVVIIPDGVLFHINFEMLSPVKIKHFDELATKSILSEYLVSYNYSLFLLNQQRTNSVKDNFVAFTPGFFDNTKAAYKKSSDTSIVIDNFYLSLIPQPFTVDLATKAAGQFGGNIFTGEQSTVDAFRQNANGHRIIHIGTHAQADNLHPQFSRLIFSKDVARNDMNNYLYLSDIYNCDLNADLTVLTACESGKVGYEDGEGLVSLAHAFNYAGSGSIVMGLWKIDEQSCAVLVKQFYDNLSKGMAKDEALQNAKLRYLRESSGRALAPQYWAGLVIMGDISPVLFEKQTNYLLLIIIAALLLFAIIFLVLRSNKKAASRKKTAPGITESRIG